MSNKLKFKKIHDDIDIAKIQREIEDNAATKDDINDKITKPKNIIKTAPKANQLSDGDMKVMDDGTNKRLYIKAGARLYYIDFDG